MLPKAGSKLIFRVFTRRYKTKQKSLARAYILHFHGEGRRVNIVYGKNMINGKRKRKRGEI